ncbi:MAG: hypothetical protein IJJ28_00565 [Lentisphaeria bacterium]|nr:hypothetical protein [Lentisphaeria bacterium]
MTQHHHHRDGIIKKIKLYFARKKHNVYLDQHGYYDSFDDHKYAKSPESFPYFPYSLEDVLESRKPQNLNIFVAAHRSTARWFKRRHNTVTLARPQHNENHYSSLKHIASYKEYRGPKIELLIWDSHDRPADWNAFIDANLAPNGVVIMVYSDRSDAMEQGFGYLGDYLTQKGFKSMEFQNPGPRREVMTAEMYYPEENVLNI